MLDTAVLSERSGSTTGGAAGSPSRVSSTRSGWSASARHRRVRRRRAARSPRRTCSSISSRATRPTSRGCAGSSSPTDLHETYWEFASQSLHRRRRGRPARTRRQVPPLEAQLQGGARRRGGQVAPGHPVLAAHQLRPADDRRVPRGRRGGHGRGRVRARQPRRAALRPLRRRRRWVGALCDRDVARAGVERGRVPDRPGRHDHRAQLPHRSRVGAQPLGPATAVAAPDATRRPTRSPTPTS